MSNINELVAQGRIITLAKFYEGAAETIKYTSKTTGTSGVIRQVKLALSMQTSRGKKLVSAVIRVPEGETPENVLATMKLKEGALVILDIDSITKQAPTSKGAESTWVLKIHTAYPYEEHEEQAQQTEAR